MRLWARSLPDVGRRLGRGPRAAVVALAVAATALGAAVGSSHRDAKFRGAGSAQAAGAPGVLTATAEAKQVADLRRRPPGRGGAAYYGRTARKQVSAKVAARFLPLYREAERRHGVNWRLLASIHHQETAFSTEPSTYHGLNDFGCCAGPMQFNVTNGPVTTWDHYRQAFREGRRPERYPHRTRSHPSVYDDFDAIMAAGSLLSDSGAGRSLDSGAWLAAYAYYGHDLFGITYANQVLARAVAWERRGFCPSCALDESLVAEFEAAYGASARRQLIAEERRSKKRKKAKRGRDRKGERRRRRGRRKDGDRRREDRARDRSRVRREHGATEPAPPRRRRRRTGPTKPSRPRPAPQQPSTAPPTTEPAPPPRRCSPVQLLGC